MSRVSLPDLYHDAKPEACTKHERLRNHLLKEIQHGQLKPGTLFPSEQEIAKRLGVSRHTVRQALASLEQEGFILRVHGKGTFVHEYVQEKLRSRSTGLFAFICPETQQGFYPHLSKSFEIAAESIHHQVIVCDTRNGVERQGNTILQLIDRDVEGIAIVPVSNPCTPAFQIRQLQNREIPVVFCFHRTAGIRAPLIGVPFEKIGEMAAKAILTTGHRHIGLFFSRSSAAANGYEAGFNNIIRNLAISDQVCLKIDYGWKDSTYIPEFEEELDIFLSQALYCTRQPVTAIFTECDSLAEFLYLKLTRAGYRVPDEISLISFGASRRVSALQQQLTAVTIDETQMATLALKYLDRMQRKEIPLRCNDDINVTVNLSAGQSLKPPIVR